MNVTGYRQKLCCGAWLLAAFLLGGMNAFPLMSMETEPPVGGSRTIGTLQIQLQKLNTIMESQGLAWLQVQDLHEAVNPTATGAPPQMEQPAVSLREGALKQTTQPLPALSGIISTLEPDGSVSVQAVLNGQCCRAKDKLDGFTIDSITPKGVVLRRSGKTWFIPCPTPLFSSDQGE